MRIHVLQFVFLLFCFTIAASCEARLQLTFTAQDEKHKEAAAEYEQIWMDEGDRIVAALEKATGLKFQETEVQVIVLEAPSSSGFGSIPMQLRASYPASTKKATLIHELGHRLHGRFFRKEDEDHPYLFLYLYDIWTELYGQGFADGEVKVESLRKGIYDYEGAWRKALAMTPSERRTKWKEFLASRK